MLSRTLGVMFKVKQLFTKNYLVLFHNTLFLVHFNSFDVIRFRSLNFKGLKKLLKQSSNVNQKAIRS